MFRRLLLPPRASSASRGAIALTGIDSWWVAIGFFGAWIFVLVILAGPLKSAGKFTVGDVLVSRFGGSSLKFSGHVHHGRHRHALPRAADRGRRPTCPWSAAAASNTMLRSSFRPVIMGLMVVLGGMMGTTYNQAIQGVILLARDGDPARSVGRRALQREPDRHDHAGDADGAADVGRHGDVATATRSPKGRSGARSPSLKPSATVPDLPSALTPGVAVADAINQFSLVLGLLLGVAGLAARLLDPGSINWSRTARE